MELLCIKRLLFLDSKCHIFVKPLKLKLKVCTWITPIMFYFKSIDMVYRGKIIKWYYCQNTSRPLSVRCSAASIANQCSVAIAITIRSYYNPWCQRMPFSDWSLTFSDKAEQPKTVTVHSLYFVLPQSFASVWHLGKPTSNWSACLNKHG